jgi:hypothetical protein
MVWTEDAVQELEDERGKETRRKKGMRARCSTMKRSRRNKRRQHHKTLSDA